MVNDLPHSEYFKYRRSPITPYPTRKIKYAGVIEFITSVMDSKLSQLSRATKDIVVTFPENGDPKQVGIYFPNPGETPSLGG